MKINREIPVRKLRLLIFDLDGTLVDSRQDLGNSVNAMLRHFGRHELPLEVIGSYIGDGAPMLVRRALGDPKDEHFVHVALQFFLDYYRKHKLDYTHVYDGVLEALRALSSTETFARNCRCVGYESILLPGVRRQQFRDQEAGSIRRAHVAS